MPFILEFSYILLPTRLRDPISRSFVPSFLNRFQRVLSLGGIFVALVGLEQLLERGNGRQGVRWLNWLQACCKLAAGWVGCWGWPARGERSAWRGASGRLKRDLCSAWSAKHRAGLVLLAQVERSSAVPVRSAVCAIATHTYMY